jgi:membrane peptidoglycan carboxypeptidase
MKYSIGFSDSKKSNHKRVTSRPKTMGTFSMSDMKTYKKVKEVSDKFMRKGKKGKKEKKPMSLKKKKILYIAGGVLFFIMTAGVLGVGIYLKNLQESLPSPKELVERSSDQSTEILDRNGEVLYTIYGDQNREWVSIDDIPEYTKWALLAAEDIEFYQHKGLDYLGIAKAVLQNLTHGEIVRGASTITQQLVKTTILYDVLGDEAYAETYTRKIKEILITIQVEQTFTKDEILQMYMNEVALGGVNYGYQAAAHSYFGKDIQDLDLAESAMLAGIIASPGYYSPLYGMAPELAEDRQDYVLDQMLKYKSLTGVTEEEVEAAREEELVYKSTEIDIKAPHFVFYVKQLLEDEFGSDRVERGGLKVTTTLDYSLQEIAEEELTEGIAERGLKYGVHNGAMVVMDPNNGEILAMVGSVDYWEIEDPKIDGNVNVTISKRQMGSSMKPYAYLTAFLKGYGPWMVAPDIDTMKFGTWKLKNWDSKYEGLITARKALVDSRNVSAAYVMQLIGIDSFIDTAEKLGVTDLSDKQSYGLSLVLGSGEMSLLDHVAAYAVFANEGVKVEKSAILKVEDAKGEVLYEKEETTEGTRVFDEKYIYALNWILCDLGDFRDRPFYNLFVINGQKICGKTGTTDGPKDLIAVQYHKNLVVGVWAGNNDNTATPGAWATTVPLPIANAFMQRVAEKYKPGSFTRPAGILSTTVCKDTGAVPGEDTECEKERSIYISGSAPQDDPRITIQLCKGENYIPSNLEAALSYGITEERTVLSFSIENSLQQSAYEKYITTNEDYMYLTEMPEEAVCSLPLGEDNAPVIEVSSPVDGISAAAGSTITISGSVRALESVSIFSISFDSTVISNSLNGDNTFSINYTIPSSTSAGTHTILIAATDNYGKSDTNGVDVNVTSATEIITLSISSPSNGSSVSMPLSITANVSGGTPSSVSFHIDKVGGGYSTTLTDYDGTDGWSVSWSDTTAPSGSYTINAAAVKGTSTYLSSTITVTY